MTIDSTTAPRTATLTLRIGVLLAVLVTILDVVGMITVGLPNAPVAVNIITGVLAIATIVGSIWAWRGASWGVWVAAVSRGLSALSILPILFAPEAPQEAIPLSIVAVALTVIAIAMMFVGLARAKRR